MWGEPEKAPFPNWNDRQRWNKGFGDPRFSCVDRGQLQQVLDEEALGASGIISPDSAAKIGRLTGAKVLVSGRVLLSKEDKVVTILASIIGTENGRVFSETEEGPRTNLEAMTVELSKKSGRLLPGSPPIFWRAQ